MIGVGGWSIGRWRTVVNVTASAACLGLVALAGHTWILSGDAARSAEGLRRVESQIAAALANLNESRLNATRATRGEADAVAALKQAAASAARANGSSLVEFKANSEPSPFLTRFSTDAEGAGWTQVEVQFTLRGAPVPLLNCLRQLGPSAPPFEFDTVELLVEPAREGRPSMIANIRLRVLIDPRQGAK